MVFLFRNKPPLIRFKYRDFVAPQAWRLAHFLQPYRNRFWFGYKNHSYKQGELL